VYRLDPALLEGWSSPSPSPYRGNHGLVAEKGWWEK
jgi:hypothetical protein